MGTDLEIIFLGTSAGTPTKQRNVSSLLIRRKSEYLLFDAGEATQRQLIKAGIGLRKKFKVFITHLHGDHVIGLLSLLQSYSLLDRRELLEIYGPRGISEFIVKNTNMLGFSPTYPMYIQVVNEGVVTEEKEYVVKALKVEHSIETYAYSIEEKPRPGKFNPVKATELGIPVRYWKTLQEGRKIVINNVEIDPRLVVSSPRPGRKIVISSDTRPTIRLANFAKGANVLIHESTYNEDYVDKARTRYHSTAKQAAEIAKRAGAKLLVLTHFSARYDNPDKLAMEAKEVYQYVIAAKDLLRLEVPYED